MAGIEPTTSQVSAPEVCALPLSFSHRPMSCVLLLLAGSFSGPSFSMVVIHLSLFFANVVEVLFGGRARVSNSVTDRDLETNKVGQVLFVDPGGGHWFESQAH